MKKYVIQQKLKNKNVRGVKSSLKESTIHLEASEKEIESKKQELGSGYHVEPVIKHSHWKEDVRAHAIQQLTKKQTSKTSVEVTIEGVSEKSTEPLYGTNVTAVLTEPKKKPTTEVKTTDENGQANFTLENDKVEIGMLMSEPAGKFWSMATVTDENTHTVDCPIIENNGPVGWWQQLMGVETENSSRGKGIKVGVIDTGVGPNPCLDNVVDLGSLIQGVYDPKGGADIDNHGSIVCGLIAGVSKEKGQYTGMAGGAEVYCLRVFAADGSGANQGDVAEAIRIMVDNHQVDLINLSLTSATASKIEHEAIQYAYEKGVVCVCAAGNTGLKVQYPAAFEESVAVGAVGLDTWGPKGSVTQILIPADKNRINKEGYYIPMFSNNGSKLDCVAPGVGLISTFPDRFNLNEAFGDLAGTSLATPMVVAFLCSVLSEDATYKKMGTDTKRAEYVKDLLEKKCVSLGLSNNLEGKGVPVL